MEEVVAAVHPIDVLRPIPPQVRINLERILKAVTDPVVSRLLFAEAVGIDAEGDQTLGAFYRTATERIARALRTGQALGVVRSGDATLIARCLLGAVQMPVFLSCLDETTLDLDALVQEIFLLLSAGTMT